MLQGGRGSFPLQWVDVKSGKVTAEASLPLQWNSRRESLFPPLRVAYKIKEMDLKKP
jgi:hypothetical protein